MRTIEEQQEHRRKRHREYMREFRKKPAAKKKQSFFHHRWYLDNKQKILQNSNRKEYQAEWHKKNKIKVAAYGIVQRAVKAGIIIPPSSCSICNRKCVIHAHHQNYLKPLDIIWICASCHKKTHLGLDFT